MHTFSNLGLAGTGVAVLVALMLLGAGALYLRSAPAAPGPVVCTADAMLCSDGSYVGRTGPNCEFVCPAPAATSTGGGGSGGGGGGGIVPFHSGIVGAVSAGPTCPVMRNPPDPQCADRALQTTVSVYRAEDTARAVAQTRSDADGQFEFSLSPGDYLVRASEQTMLPRCTEESVQVLPDSYIAVAISCDTGIR